MKNLKKRIKNKSDINKINEEITKIQKSRFPIQGKLRPLLNKEFVKDSPELMNSLVVKKQQYERRLKLIVKNLRKILSMI